MSFMTDEDKLHPDIAPPWLDFDFLSKWRIYDYIPPLMVNIEPEDEFINGFRVINLCGDDRKVSKNRFLRTTRPTFTKQIEYKAPVTMWNTK